MKSFKIFLETKDLLSGAQDALSPMYTLSAAHTATNGGFCTNLYAKALKQLGVDDIVDGLPSLVAHKSVLHQKALSLGFKPSNRTKVFDYYNHKELPYFASISKWKEGKHLLVISRNPDGLMNESNYLFDKAQQELLNKPEYAYKVGRQHDDENLIKHAARLWGADTDPGDYNYRLYRDGTVPELKTHLEKHGFKQLDQGEMLSIVRAVLHYQHRDVPEVKAQLWTEPEGHTSPFIKFHD